MSSPEAQIRAFYRELFKAWGPQHWWPAQSRFEVIVGAFLTQNTAWTNVERTLRELRRARMLTLDGIRRTALGRIEQHVRSAGFFRQKARRLKQFVAFLDARYGGSLDRMFARPTAELRAELLALEGVGPETADSILLYAGGHPVFVVDAYTRRILERHGAVLANAAYEEIGTLFERALQGQNLPTTNDSACSPNSATVHRPSRVSSAARSTTAQVYNEMHGLLVAVAKNYCLKSQARCDQCPLRKFLPASK